MCFHVEPPDGRLNDEKYIFLIMAVFKKPFFILRYVIHWLLLKWGTLRLHHLRFQCLHHPQEPQPTAVAVVVVVTVVGLQERSPPNRRLTTLRIRKLIVFAFVVSFLVNLSPQKQLVLVTNNAPHHPVKREVCIGLYHCLKTCNCQKALAQDSSLQPHFHSVPVQVQM